MCNCNGTGVNVMEIFPGVILTRPCDCQAAARNREMAEQELRTMLEAIRRERSKENTVAGL